MAPILNWKAIYRLMRFDKPVGLWLLWFPAAWALWIANRGAPPWRLVLWFFLGTVVMRAAGCVVNDMADRNIDRHVHRTAERPLTTGELSLMQAMGVFLVLVAMAFVIVIQLPLACFYYAMMGLLVTVIYPFCKRWIKAPQLVLSVAFSVSIPMLYAASHVTLDQNTAILVIITLCWVLSYDTLYAMVDRDDDRRIGVQSTAILFGKADRAIIAMLQGVFHALWWWVSFDAPKTPLFYMGWVLGGGVLLIQNNLIQIPSPTNCFKAFKLNAGYGFLMWISVMQNANPWL